MQSAAQHIPSPPHIALQVWGVISQQRQEGTGGLARLHSALISTGAQLTASAYPNEEKRERVALLSRLLLSRDMCATISTHKTSFCLLFSCQLLGGFLEIGRAHV